MQTLSMNERSLERIEIEIEIEVWTSTRCHSPWRRRWGKPRQMIRSHLPCLLMDLDRLTELTDGLTTGIPRLYLCICLVEVYVYTTAIFLLERCCTIFCHSRAGVKIHKLEQQFGHAIP